MRNSGETRAAARSIDVPSALLIGIYVPWVVGYDLPWIYSLWRANSADRTA